MSTKTTVSCDCDAHKVVPRHPAPETIDAALNPCPFCGGDDLEIINTHTPSFWVECVDCNARVPGGYVKGPRRDDRFHYEACPDGSKFEATYDELYPEYQKAFRSAVLAWNTRASRPEAQIPGQAPEAPGMYQYPTGDVVGACVCGSWPGGECLKCTVLPAKVDGGEREVFEREIALLRGRLADGEQLQGQIIDERDRCHEMADRLTDEMGAYFGVDFGEHSNLNCPWQNAIEYVHLSKPKARRVAYAPHMGRTTLSVNHGEDKRDAQRYRDLRDIPEDQMGSLGIPCIAIPIAGAVRIFTGVDADQVVDSAAAANLLGGDAREKSKELAS